MINRLIPLLFILLFSSNIKSQDFLYQDYDWPEDPSVYVCPDSLLDKPEVTLLKKSIAEYGYIGDDFVERFVFHKVNYLSSDDAIESNNRVYLPIDADESLEVTKARVINPDGTVIELNKEDINKAEDEDGNVTFYYAFKGMVKGSIIEYFYIHKMPAQYTGVRYLIQNDNPQLNVDFEIVSPKNLVFTYMGKNGFGKMEVDTSDEHLNHLVRHFDYIVPFKPEPEAFIKPNVLQVLYKLSANRATGKQDIISYGSIADYIIGNYTVAEKKDNKIVAKWIKESGAGKEENSENKLRKLEVYLKKMVAIYDANADELENITFISENKATNSTGFIKIISLACEQMDIQYEIVITSDRTKMPFEPDYESYNFLQDYLIYFPEIDMYLDPSDAFGALGIVSTNSTDQYGAFYQQVKLGEFSSGISQIKFIKGLSAEKSHHDMIMDVSVSDDFTNLNVHLSIIATGYFAAVTQPFYDILEPEEISDFNDEQVKWITDDMEIDLVDAKNKGFENLGVKPFVIESDYTTSDFIVKARDKYLFKIGLLIGPQSEMYQEQKRTLPVDMGYRKFYHREIVFTVPEDYKISNPEDLNLQVKAKDNEGTYAEFTSSYTLEGNKLKVVVDEYYTKVHFPVEEFEDYRAVINSAADFNKIVLFLEKK